MSSTWLLQICHSRLNVVISKLCFTSVLRSILMIGFLSSIIVSPAFSVETDDSAVFLSGFNAYHKQNYSKAIEDLNEFLRKFPQSQVRDMAIFWLARSYFKYGNYHEAARSMSQFVREYPENPLRATAETDLLALMDRYDKGERLPSDEVKGGEQVQARQAKPEGEQIAQELDRVAKEKLAKEQTAREQLSRQLAEKERVAKRQADQERLADEKGEQEVLTAHEPLSRQKTEKERIAKLQAEHERLDVDKAELNRLAAEQAEKERVAKVKTERERLAAEQVAREQLSRQQAENERVAKLRAEQERLDVEKVEMERLAAEQAEKERVAKVKAEQAEKERVAKVKAEQAEKERVAKVKAEQERLAAEQAAREQLSRQQAEYERVAKLRAEQERLDVEKAEMERLAAEQAEKERVAKEKAEQEHLAAEQKKHAAFQSGQPLVATNVELPQPTSLLLPTTMIVPLSTTSPDKHDVKHIPASEDHPSYALIAGESSVLAQLDPVVAKLSSAHYQPVITSKRSDTEAYLLAVGCYGDREAALQKRDNLVNQSEQAFVIKNDALYCVATKTFVVENEAKKELDRLEAHGVEGVKVIKAVTIQNSWVLSTGHYSTIRAAVEATLVLERVGVAATIVKSNELGE
jgi:myosin heavy subunit